MAYSLRSALGLKIALPPLVVMSSDESVKVVVVEFVKKENYEMSTVVVVLTV